MAKLLLSKYLPYRLTILAARVARTFASRHIDRYRISIPEWRVIMSLAHLGPTFPGHIVGFAEMDKAKVNRATTRLAAMNLIRVTPDPSDGRRSTMALTAAGQHLHDEIVPIALRVEKELLSVLDRDERQMLDRLLSKLDAKIRDMSAASVPPRNADGP